MIGYDFFANFTLVVDRVGGKVSFVKNERKETMKSEHLSNSAGRIRPDLTVGALARLAFETYFQRPARQEITRLQDGDYCNATFRMIPSLPVLKRVDEILQVPGGCRAGEFGYLNKRYWKREYLIDGVKYRLTSNWHEPPHSCDNRTPLEDWIRRMEIQL